MTDQQREKGIHLYEAGVSNDRPKTSGIINIDGKWFDFGLDVWHDDRFGGQVTLQIGDFRVEANRVDGFKITRHVRVEGHDDGDEYPVIFECPISELSKPRPNAD